MMCPDCYDKLPAKQVGDDDESWRDDVTKDGGDIAFPSGGTAVLGATSKVKKIMKKPAAKGVVAGVRLGPPGNGNRWVHVAALHSFDRF